MAPSRRPSRKPAEPSEESGSDQQNTRIKAASAVRRGAPREEEEYAAEEESDEGDEGSYDDPSTAEESMPSLDEEDDNPDATRAGPPLKLEIIEGPDRGQRKRFKSVRMVIGRGQDCELTLTDQSVSRRHVELVFGGESGVLLRDLGSGNGTKVNDERVDERKLVHEDVISLGRTKIRLIDQQELIKRMRAAEEEEARKKKEAAELKARQKEEAAKKAAEGASAEGAAAAGAAAEGGEPQGNGEENKKTQVRSVHDIPRRNAPKRRMGLMVAGALVLLIALLGGGVLFLKRGPPPPPPPNPKEVQARSLMDDARKAFRAGNYEEAVKLAEEAESLFPGIDAEGFLPVARAELAIVRAFAQVRALMDENKFDEARELLEQTPHGTAQLTEEMREKLEAELETRELEYLVKQVEAALEARDVEGARALIQRLPMEQQPLYLGKLAELEKLLAQEAADSLARDKAARAAAARRAKEQREAFIAAAFGVVETRFNASDFPRAVLECDRVIDANPGDKEIRERAKLLKKLIPQFARVYQDAQRKVQQNALESAARPLRSSAELYRQIGLKGPFGDIINGQLAGSSVVAGKAALARNDLANAASFFGEALRLRPDDPKAQEGMAAIQGKLEDLFKQAYFQRDRDPEGSAQKFRLILQLAAEGSEVKTKAQTQLEALEQQP
ncbi:FHA domain-containing protein [Archangium violaceum]|uniref:FHA domain-containing protein n=1 Tax=Archangium violaceum TaxID=83451 RepID=UPI0019527B5A|nr:FHA domain-containing protein [Archangium violaceum]QRO00507.1 FHA domain-containing protein [Archangium violaceum]